MAKIGYRHARISDNLYPNDLDDQAGFVGTAGHGRFASIEQILGGAIYAACVGQHPCIQSRRLIGRTIESVLGQEFTDFDLLIVDDASTDNTVEVANQYTRNDPRIKLSVNEHNLGLTRNWNRCLDLAEGPLVQILLSDDLIDADYLKIASERFAQDPRVGFVAASCRYIDAEDQVIHPGTPKPACPACRRR